MWSSAPKQDKHDEPMKDPAARVKMSSPTQQTSYGAEKYKIPAHMDDNEKIMLEVGAGYFLEENVDKARAYCERKSKQL